MSADYKHRAQPKFHSRPTPPWIWLLVGFLLGAFTLGLAWLKLTPPQGGAGWIGAGPDRGQTSSTKGKEQEAPKESAPRPRFDYGFYSMLPQMEVVVPEEELELEVSKHRMPDKAPSSYLIQVGAFKKSSDAERLKAQLSLLGFDVRVQKVLIDSGTTYHRVRVGSYPDRGAVKSARRQLSENGYKDTVILNMGR